MRPATVSKNIILVNGSDAIAGVEGGRRLVYHARWRQYLMYVSNYGIQKGRLSVTFYLYSRQ